QALGCLLLVFGPCCRARYAKLSTLMTTTRSKQRTTHLPKCRPALQQHALFDGFFFQHHDGTCLARPVGVLPVDRVRVKFARLHFGNHAYSMRDLQSDALEEVVDPEATERVR